jgi:hypothetical protein
MTGKAIAYFFFGFVAGLIIVESQRDRPFAPVAFHDGKALETRIYYYRYNPYSQGNNSGSRTNTNTGGGNIRGTEQGESHGRTVEVNDRKKN